MEELQVKMKLLPSGRFMVRSDGFVMAFDGSPLQTFNVGTELFVRTVGHNGQIFDISLAKLVLLTFIRDDSYLHEFHERLEFLYVDGNPTNCSIKNIIYRFKNGPIESEFKGYYHIPFFTKYVISKDGRVLSTHTYKPKSFSKKVTENVTKDNTFYLQTALVSDLGVNVHVCLHRLMALTFLPYSENVDELVVNHKDGKTDNNTVDNLEWCTRAENNQHAYDMGLNVGTGNAYRRVVRVNILTGEREDYLSVSEAARCNGYAFTAAMSKRIASKTVSDNCYFKFKDEPDCDPTTLVKLVERASAFVKAVDSDEIVEYKNASQASNATGVPLTNITYAMKTNHQRPLNGYLFSRDGKNFPKLSQELIGAFKNAPLDAVAKGNCVKITNENGETFTFISINEAARHMDLSADTLRRALKKPDNGKSFKIELINA